MSCIFRSTKSCIRERFLIPGRVVYFSKWFQTVPLLSLWNQVVTGIACWSRECVLKILSVCKKDSAWVFEWCQEVFWWQDKGFFLSSSLSEATFGGPFQPNSFHESISTLLWRTTNTINLYKHKWINFIRNVMQPKSIVKFLLPSKETKHCTEYIIKWTGKHCHTAVTIVITPPWHVLTDTSMLWLIDLQIVALVQHQVKLKPKNPITAVFIFYAISLNLSTKQDQTWDLQHVLGYHMQGYAWCIVWQRAARFLDITLSQSSVCSSHQQTCYNVKRQEIFILFWTIIWGISLSAYIIYITKHS